jgi:NADH-quinone oxidoreductase subunit F
MEKVLLKNIDKPDSHRIDTYLAGGGYKALEKALTIKPDGIRKVSLLQCRRGRARDV